MNNYKIKILIAIIIILTVGNVFQSRRNANLQNELDRVNNELKEKLVFVRDSIQLKIKDLNKKHSKELNNLRLQLDERRKTLSFLIHKNNQLKNELENVKKNLPYNNRKLDTAIIIITKYRYPNSKTEKNSH